MLDAALTALVPVILLIGFGHALGRSGRLTADFWRQAEWLSYFILLPALFMNGLATADLSGVPIGRLFLVLIASLLVTSAILIACRGRMPVDGPAFTSVFQGGVRFNNYVGVMVATGLYGAEGTALAAVANAAIVPTVNILSVLVFSRYGETRLSMRKVVASLATNPLILSCLLGLAMQRAGIPMPEPVSGALDALGRSALAIGLLCVGAALRPDEVGQHRLPIAASLIFKFACLPLVTLAIILLAGLSGREAVIALMFHALPTASSSYILARQLGGNSALMANIIAVQTMLGAITIPAAVLIASTAVP
ncbi:AEC family transporter [Paracoccus sp. TK19116]|uniref:AEC family transporter n=1 Tax=Paracoccus albicereus TaxID=2922394 RepID=A0ABT1MTW8_9RHOB|nr:AEC family transporter [Paracoccus albicereus]MCQ0971636.1 AEC family transporter [Paracoccus albicereus]